MKYMPFMNGSGIKLIQNINVIKRKKHNVNYTNFEMWGLLSIFSIFLNIFALLATQLSH